MKIPFVARATHMLMVQAANQAAIEREHERRRAERVESRYDDLLRSYMALKRDGYQEGRIIDADEIIVVTSVEDADAEAAKREADIAERAD